MRSTLSGVELKYLEKHHITSNRAFSELEVDTREAYIADLDGVEKLFKRLLRTSTSTPLFLAKVLASPLE